MKRLLLICCWLISSHCLLAQNGLQGRVVDSDRRPINGASILDDDGRTIAFSDSSGFFSLARPFPGRITVSHVSYADRGIDITQTPNGILEIILHPVDNLIEEVEISTGFQYIPKERATGAFSHISNETFNEQVSTDVLSRLEAVANGVDFSRVTTLGGSDMGIRIRGLSTLSTGSIRDPLIILDNFPYEGDLNNINPNDVENITLLKDAAATSIWGARAGNGVIVITTKSGRYNQPLQIDFNGNITISDKPDLGYYPQMDAGDFIEVERFLFERNHRFSDTASLRRPPFSPAYEIMFQKWRGEINEGQMENMLSGLSRSDVRNQYLQYLYEPSINRQYALSLQGGDDNIAWHLSTGYDRNKSSLRAVDDRFNISFKNTYTPFKSLQLQVGLTYTQGQSANGKTGYSDGTIPYIRIADEGGHALPVMRNYRQPFLDTLAGGSLLDWHYYPLTDDRHIHNQSSRSHTLLNVGANYKLFRWLALDVKYQYGRQQTRNDNLNGEGSYYTRNLINQFSQLSPTTGQVHYIVPLGAILDLTRSSLQSHNLRGQINVSNKWGAHDVMALVGAEVSHRNTNGNSNRTYGYNADILTFSQLDYLSQYPHFITGGNSFIPQGQNFSHYTNRFISTFANAAYTYLTKYTFSLSGRRDASNQFGVNFNDRWNLLWSAGISWEASKEAFLNFDVIPYLRLRATYGFSGNTDLGKSAVTTIRYSGTSQYLNTPMSYVSQDANPELGWEQVKMVNLAMDFRLKGSRLSGSIDVFVKDCTNLFGQNPVDPTTGILTSVVRNVAALKGRGVDVELNSLNVNREVKWSTNFNFSYYTDAVTKYYFSSLNASHYVVEPGFPTYIEGERLHSLYSYRWGGLESGTGDPIGYIDGAPSKNYNSILGSGSQMVDLVKHGSAVPRLFGSLGNTLNYKNVGLTVRFIYKMGHFFRNEGIRYNQLFAGQGGGQHPEYSQRWQQPGDELITSVPSMIYPATATRDQYYLQSEVKVQRGDNIRLQYVNLYYDIVNKSLTSLPLQNLRVYVNVANIGLIWKKSDVSIDPDYGVSSLPPVPTYSFGLRFGL